MFFSVQWSGKKNPWVTQHWTGQCWAAIWMRGKEKAIHRKSPKTVEIFMLHSHYWPSTAAWQTYWIWMRYRFLIIPTWWSRVCKMAFHVQSPALNEVAMPTGYSVPGSGLNLVQNTPFCKEIQALGGCFGIPCEWKNIHIPSATENVPSFRECIRPKAKLQPGELWGPRRVLQKKGNTVIEHPAMAFMPATYSHELLMASTPICQNAGETHAGNQIIFTGKHCSKDIIHWIHPGWRGPVGSCILGKAEVYSCRGFTKCSWNP